MQTEQTMTQEETEEQNEIPTNIPKEEEDMNTYDPNYDTDTTFTHDRLEDEPELHVHYHNSTPNRKWTTKRRDLTIAGASGLSAAAITGTTVWFYHKKQRQKILKQFEIAVMVTAAKRNNESHVPYTTEEVYDAREFVSQTGRITDYIDELFAENIRMKPEEKERWIAVTDALIDEQKFAIEQQLIDNQKHAEQQNMVDENEVETLHKEDK